MEPTRKISEVAFEYAHRLRTDPNIRAVGYGMKQRAGAVVAGHCLVFYVRQKLRQEQDGACCGTWWVPSVVEGYPTDVVVVGRYVAGTDVRPATPSRVREELPDHARVVDGGDKTASAAGATNVAP